MLGNDQKIPKLLKDELEFKIKENKLPLFTKIVDNFSKSTIKKVVEIVKSENFLPG